MGLQMTVRLGINQQLILRAFQLLEAKHGHSARVTAGQLIDAIWFEVERLCAPKRSGPDLDPKLAAKVRQIRTAHDRISAAKRRKGVELRSHRSWSLAVEAINPAACFRRLTARGLIERTGHTLALTQAGRRAIEKFPLLSAPPSAHSGRATAEARQGDSSENEGEDSGN
jgi:hypothetical protein